MCDLRVDEPCGMSCARHQKSFVVPQLASLDFTEETFLLKIIYNSVGAIHI